MRFSSWATDPAHRLLRVDILLTFAAPLLVEFLVLLAILRWPMRAPAEPGRELGPKSGVKPVPMAEWRSAAISIDNPGAESIPSTKQPNERVDP